MQIKSYRIKLKKATQQKKYEIPKVFWKYYDLYRRGLIDLDQYAENSGLSSDKITECLKYI